MIQRILPYRSLLVALAVAASSGVADAELTAAEQRCQAQVARSGGKFFNVATRSLRRCRERIASGGLPPSTDCTLEPVTAARLARAEGQLASSIGRRCDDPTAAGLNFGDACYGVTTVADLTACQSQVHQDQAEALLAILYDASGETSGSVRRCQRALARQAQRFAQTKQARISHCRDKVAKGALGPTTNCAFSQNEGFAIDAARDAAARAMESACSDSDVAALSFAKPCVGNDASVDSAIACLLGTHEQGADRVLFAEYGSSPGGFVSVKQITNQSECIAGPLARCRPGDYLFENGEIEVVVQGIQRNLYGIGQYGGQIIDADVDRVLGDPSRDNFEEWTTHINIENIAHYTSLTIINDGSDGQPAILRATGVDDLLDFVNPSSVVAGFGFSFPASADDKDLPVEIKTDYILEGRRNYVRVETTIQNVGGTPFNTFFGEYINGSGQLEMFQPGYGFGEPLAGATCITAVADNPCNTTAYAGIGAASGVSYGYVHEINASSAFTTSGVTVPLLGIESVLGLIGAAPPNFPLAAMGNPGDSLTFTRYFVVGDGSVNAILRTRNEIQYRATGQVTGTVTAGGSPVEGVRVVLLGSPGAGPGAQIAALATYNVVTVAITDEDGSYTLDAAPGSYNVIAQLDGHPYQGGGTTPTQNPVSVLAFETTTQNIALPGAGAIQVTVVDEAGAPIAAKASVLGFDPSPQLNNSQLVLGTVSNVTGVFHDREDTQPFGVPRVLFIDQTGISDVVTMEPGSYRVVASHGTEYSIASDDITVVAGATTPVSLQIARVIDTSNYVSSDFHVHLIHSPDAAVSAKDRVVSALAEGLDMFTPSDHDFRVDLNPVIADIGATGLISVPVSGEITTFDYGHFNAWPMTIDPSQVNGGSVDHGGAAADGMDFPALGSFSLTPAQIVAAAKADPGTDTVQINHFYSHMGLGDSGLAIDTGLTPPQSLVPGQVRRLNPVVPNYFTDTFDALEIWIESSRSQVSENVYGRNLGDWFNMINQNIVRTAVGDSDTHSTMLNQVGFPRTMVASPTDDPGALGGIADTLSGNVNDGRAIATNGPMVRITSSATSTGEVGSLDLGFPRTISTTDGAVDITLDIQSPAWAEFDRIEFYVNPVTIRATSSEPVGGGFPAVIVPRYGVSPDFVFNDGVEFNTVTVNVDPMVPGADRLEATATLSLTGLTEDVWVVAIVRGTDNVSRPLFPVVPNDLRTNTNTTLANLIDGNLGENGAMAMAIVNPLFVDVDGGGWTPPGVQFVP